MSDMKLSPEQMQMLAKADAAVKKLSSGYVTVLLDELNKLRADLEAGNDEDAIILIHQRLHN